jgi:uncharacterized membrane protein YesL
MWLSRPLYELLPYLYMVLGIVLLGLAWHSTTLPGLMMFVGAATLLAGIVLWLRRRDYRSRQAEYDEKSLDR